MKKISLALYLLLITVLLPNSAWAISTTLLNLHTPSSIAAIIAVILFILAYLLVVAEELTHLRKSKPVVLVGSIIWALVAIEAKRKGLSHAAEETLSYYILEYGELFLFLLVAMTYVNTMQERGVFESLRAWLVQKGFSYRQLFWLTGLLAFCISPVADNLTTALIMGAVVMAVGGDNKKFITLSCINIVVAANAGGAFSPFGDITTLMVWQKDLVEFKQFFYIFLPSLINFLVPAIIMHFALPNASPQAIHQEATLKHGACFLIFLFLFTIALAVTFHNFLELPPVAGMMAGLGLLQFLAYYLKLKEQKLAALVNNRENTKKIQPFDFFRRVENAEWDTLLFFYGIILGVGGLATFGYLELISNHLYHDLGRTFSPAYTATPANIIIGLLSAVIDNIPVMFAVITMQPDMSTGQWLLVTLTAGVGGSLLSIGSAAGVALMGQSKGQYTFLGHLKWSWAIALGYAAAIGCHLWINQHLF